jgi:hypothetical protein
MAARAPRGADRPVGGPARGVAVNERDPKKKSDWIPIEALPFESRAVEACRGGVELSRF